MKKLFLSILFVLLLAAQGWGATYYVDSAVTDTNVASATPDFTTYNPVTFATDTGSASVFKTIADINAFAALAAGDSVLFRKGQTWREQLTVPSSGSAGNPITFGAYGSGADPIIDGSDIISTWVLDPAWQIGVSAADDFTNNAATNRRIAIVANTSSYSGTKIRLTVKAGPDGDVVIVGSSIGISTANDDYDAAPTRITWDTGSNGTTIAAGTSKTSDEIAFTFTKTNRHIVAYFNSSGFPRFKQSGVTGVGLYYGGVTDTSQDQTVVLSGPVAERLDIASLEIETTGVANVYNSTVVATPNQVFKDGVRATKGASKAALNDHEWFSDSTTLSMRDDSGDPDGLGYVITASVRNYGITTNTKDYITVNGVAIVKANTNGVYMTDYTNNILDSMDISYSYQAGVQFYYTNSGTLGTLQNSDLSYNGVFGASIPIAVDVAGVSYTTIQNNNIHHNYQGLEFDQLSSYGIARYNNIHDNTDFGIVINNSDNNSVYYNLVRGNGATTGIAGMVVMDSGEDGMTGNVIYNNVFYNNGEAGLDIRNEQSNLKVKNNLFVKNSLKAVFSEIILTGGFTYTGLDIDYNIYYHDTEPTYWDSHCWKYAGEAHNFADWKTHISGDSHSAVIDPLFISTVTPDFHLQPSSPALNAGVDVCATLVNAMDYAGKIICQGGFFTGSGSAPEPGAYEFIPISKEPGYSGEGSDSEVYKRPYGAGTY